MFRGSSKNVVGKERQDGAALAQSLKERLEAREKFFQGTFRAEELLQPLERVPGLLYFVKDTESRLMAASLEALRRMGFAREEEVLGLRPHDYLPKEIADRFVAGDRQVLETGQQSLNAVEMWFDEGGRRDWMFTDKFPLRNGAGEVVGLIGTAQGFAARRELLAHFGPAGKAADYIRERLGERLPRTELARQAGVSERQLQRLFPRVFGMTVQQFVIQSRIHAAIHELLHTDRTLAEIAARYGFTDQSAFSNTFRHVTGRSPREYRQDYLDKYRTTGGREGRRRGLEQREGAC